MWHPDEISPEVIMLDCEESSDSCKHCQENGTYWAIQLDQDLLETIVSIYPEWFKDCNYLPNMAHDNTHQMMAEGGKIIIPLYHTRDVDSPPKAIVDEASLQKAMNKNKESLKVKLLLRRPLNQLVEQGIMPPLKTSPHFHEQRQKLERAKMGDMLKNKIQRRPDRRELIQQHILEDTTVDPSLQDKQRQLKKARLADDLNDRLSHRPGPLELIKGNILQTDEMFAQAVKEGHIPFKRTCEGQTQKHPPQRFVLDEDSGSEGAPSPQDITEHSQSSSIPSLDINDVATSIHGSPDSQMDIKPRVTAPSSTTNESVSQISNQLAVGTSLNSFNRLENGAVSTKARKKSKSKSQPKTRTIKFHEYKGPPSAQKNQMSSSAADAETSYELLLQQQQLFLQWQLEWQQKYPQIILPVAQKPNGDQVNSSGSGHLNTQLCDQSVIQESTASLQRNLSKLEEMKVSDLKAELKKRNLPVSGSKPQLIERLKPYSDFSTTINQFSSFSDALTAVTTINNNSLPVTVGGILIDTAAASQNKTDIFPLSAVTANTNTDNVTSNVLREDVALGVYQIPTTIAQLVTSRPSSVAPMDVDSSPHAAVEAMDVSESVSPMSSEELVKMQQKKIEELQRELQRSQMQLQQQQQSFLQQSQPQQAISSTSLHLHSQQVADNVKKVNNQGSHVDCKQSQRQMLQQRFQEKIQQQQQQQIVQPTEQRQQSHQPFATASTTSTASSHPTSAAVKASLAAFLHNQHATSSLASISIANPVMSHIAASQPVVSIPARVLTSSHVPAAGDQLKNYCKSQTGVDSPVTTTHSASFKNSTSYPNGITHQRITLSPTISGQLQNDKRIKAESSFATKPPPDYNEATKQLVKSQQPLQINPELREENSSEQCNQRTLKSQVIDDVLEILIKNGELPPSAAQDPPSENIRIPRSSAESTYSSVSHFPVIPTSSQSNNKLQMTTSISAPRLAVGNTLMTPPSSSVLGNTENNANTPLDFDFHLDLDDIEAMDLGSVLVGDGSNNNNIIKSEHSQLPNIQQNILEETDNSVTLPDSGANMDVALPDWLDVMMPSASTNIPSHHSVNNIVEQNNARNTYRNNDPDPLLSTLANSNDPYDLFSIEDLDFKSSSADLNLHSWDKVDFAA